MRIRKSHLYVIAALTAVLTLNVSLYIGLNQKVTELDAYSASSLPTTINLNDCTEQEIRSYYSGLNSLTASERKGTNLLKNLKPILMNNQKYCNYDSGDNVWKIYEISDRDWEKSPASSTTYGTYNSNTNTITNYQYGSDKNNPYIHALYIDRDIDNQTRAWGNHNQDAWGINREHIWAKSHGFDSSGAGGARGDPMHLWAANGWANHEHSNYFFAFVDTSRAYSDAGSKYNTVPNNLTGYSKNAGGNQTVFEPQDSDKGDIARAIFYMVARYNNYAGNDNNIDTNNPNLVLLNDLSENTRTGTSTANNPYGMGLLSDLLAWNKLDPVDEYERHRNNLLYRNYTNNRNPFIDFPNWADAIWGTADLDGTNYSSVVNTSANPSTDPIGSTPLNTFCISSSHLDLEVGDTAEIYGEYANGAINWSVDDETVIELDRTTTSNYGEVTITALKGGTATITATNSTDSVTCTVTVTEPTPQELIEDIDTNTILAYHYVKTISEGGVTDTLTHDFIGVNGSTYTSWNSKEGTSGVIYAGQSGGGDNTSGDAIQLRTKNNNSGIIVTDNDTGSSVSSISITWNTASLTGRTIDVYGRDTAYTSPTELHGSSKGTLICSLSYDGEHTETSVDIDDEYEFIGLRSRDGASYLMEIQIEWGGASSTTYTYSNVSIRFGAVIDKDLWDDLDTDSSIEGFGVMITTDDVISGALKIKDFWDSASPAEDDPIIDEEIVDYYMSLSEMAVPPENGNNYVWNLFHRVSEIDFDTTFVAAAYIKTFTGYVFFKQVSYSVISLATDYLANRGYDSSTANGSLYRLANL